MARARNIKPGFFKNELLAELPIGTRLIFIGLWCLADREGRLEDRPKKIKLEIMPFDSFDVDHALQELEQHGFIERYTVGNQKIIHVVNFHKHQSPHGTEKDSPLPDKNGELTVHKRGKNGYIMGDELLSNSALTVKPPLDNALNPDILNPDSLIPDSLISNNTEPRKRVTKSTRLPADWTLPDDWATWAIQNKPGIDVQETAATFADYWHSEAKGKADWFATWRNWVRRQKVNTQSKPTPVSFAQQERERGWKRWEEMTGRQHPERLAHEGKSQGYVIDVSNTGFLEIEQ